MKHGNHNYENQYKEHNYGILIILIIVILIIGAIVFYYHQSTKKSTEMENANSQDTSTTETVIYTAEEIVNKLKESGLDIGRIVVYNEETDPNSLLGRPNQYITKANFEDLRIEDNSFLDEDTMIGGTIETFNNFSDLQSRQEYCEAFSSSAMFSQYIYGNTYALLRLDNELTPSQASEYETIFNNIIDGNN